jgi:AcrR family transcriptional regulator
MSFLNMRKKSGPAHKKAKPGRQKTASRRKEKKEHTKAEILAAALQLFQTKGVGNTTAKEIATKAGIAEGTFFNYFPTKEDLALYFFQKGIDDLIQWYDRQGSLKQAPIEEKLFAIIHRQLEQLKPYEDFIGSVFFRSLEPRSKLNALSFESQENRLRYLRFIDGLLKEAIQRGEIPDVGRLGAYGVGLFYMGIVTFWLHDMSHGKQKTLALLDRSLVVATRFLRKGGWEWK